jgi:multidrug efflux pump subunit AcrB
MSFLSLKTWDERKRSVDQIIQDMMPKVWAIPGVLIYPLNLSSLPGSSSMHPIEVALQRSK